MEINDKWSHKGTPGSKVHSWSSLYHVPGLLGLVTFSSNKRLCATIADLKSSRLDLVQLEMKHVNNTYFLISATTICWLGTFY